MREVHPQVLTESMATLARQLPKSVSDGEAGALVRSMSCRVPQDWMSPGVR